MTDHPEREILSTRTGDPSPDAAGHLGAAKNSRDSKPKGPFARQISRLHPMDYSRQKQRAALLSVGSNSLLVAAKLGIGTYVGSVSILSEAIHSGVDLVAALIALAAVRAASKPPDVEHPYGHGKIENLSGAIEALLIAVAGIWIVIEAVQHLLHPSPIEHPILGVLVMGCSVVVNVAVSSHLFVVAKRTHSVALEADAWHLRTDVWTSAAILGALGLVTLGRVVAPRHPLNFVDPLCAVGVAILILKAAWDLTRQSLGDLLDESIPQWERDDLCALLNKRADVVGVHGIRTRKNGSHRYVELHLVVHPDMTVRRVHELEHELQAQMRELLGESRLLAHVEPCDKRCTDRCRSGCFLSPDLRAVTGPPPSARPPNSPPLE
ncbi:MAG: cation diffusion facilitator family transporter [Polyangiaceae bacterium]